MYTKSLFFCIHFVHIYKIYMYTKNTKLIMWAKSPFRFQVAVYLFVTAKAMKSVANKTAGKTRHEAVVHRLVRQLLFTQPLRPAFDLRHSLLASCVHFTVNVMLKLERIRVKHFLTFCLTASMALF